MYSNKRILALLCLILILILIITACSNQNITSVTNNGMKESEHSLDISSSESEIPTDSRAIETESVDTIDMNKEYWSDVLQQSGGKVYYCSSDEVPAILNLPILDFSEVKPDYIKVTGKDNSSISSFIIYRDRLFYISNYGYRDYYKGPYSFGDLYVSDLSGNDCKLIEADVSDLRFMIADGKLYYQLYEDVLSSYTSKCYLYDLSTEEISSSNKELGSFTSKYIFKSVYSNDDYTEFDGGYYYVKRLGADEREINGEPANWIYIREDIQTGNVEEVGHSFSQVG